MTPGPESSPDRISIELTNQCSKHCWFCYNQSAPGKQSRWTVNELVAFVSDCAANGIRAVSFGGGEPLEFPGVFDVLKKLDGLLFRSMTTNGLLLDRGLFDPLIESKPDKVHVSIHFPEKQVEVDRVIRHVLALQHAGVKSGVNLLVAQSNLYHARAAARDLADAGITNDRIVYLPMRGSDTPTPDETGHVAATSNFQSMSCLHACAKSDRFCSIGWDKSVAWCSYTKTRRTLDSLTYAGLMRALGGLGLSYCGSDYVQIGKVATASHQTKTADKPAGILALPDAWQHEVDALETVTCDFPAAHSMDSQWFAIDAAGHVAMFVTGPEGSVPILFRDTYGPDFYGTSLLDLLCEDALPRTLQFAFDDFDAHGPGHVYVPADLDLSAELAQPAIDRASRSSVIPPALYELRDEAVLSELPDQCKLLPASNRVMAWSHDFVSKQAVEALLKDGSIRNILIVMHAPLHRMGIFIYECNTHPSGHYDRIIAPVTPLHIDELAGQSRAMCNLIEFDTLRFLDCNRIQPIEHMPCRIWGDHWTDLEGNTHASTPDFPAAHSMDTEWFATDANGHVAVFDSGEPGAVPTAFLDTEGYQFNAGDVLDDVARNARPGAFQFDLDDLAAAGPGHATVPLTHPASGIDYHTIVASDEINLRDYAGMRVVGWLRDERVLERFAGRPINRLPDRERVLIQLPVNWGKKKSVEHVILQNLLDTGEAIGACVSRYELPAYRMGLFSYQCDEGGTPPYDRVAVPRYPLAIDDLPDFSHRVCTRVVFDSLRFADVMRIQPYAMMKCGTWEYHWTDLDGNLHEIRDSKDGERK